MGAPMATPDPLLFATRDEALSAALAEVRRAVLARLNVCVRLVGGRGRINVTEIRGPKKIIKRYRWTSGEAA
jgi:hypothetical protein